MPRAKPGKRQSCDRCHAQKVRCSQSDCDSGPCVRCSRQKTQCVYSTALPRGRPSAQRSTRIRAGSIADTQTWPEGVPDTAEAGRSPPTRSVGSVSVHSQSWASPDPLLISMPSSSPQDVPVSAWSWKSLPTGWDEWLETGNDSYSRNREELLLSSPGQPPTSLPLPPTALDATPPPGTTNDASNTCESCIQQLSELVSSLSHASTIMQHEFNTESLISSISSDAVTTLHVSPGVNLILSVPGVSCKALQDTFAASQRLLDILHRLYQLTSDTGAGYPRQPQQQQRQPSTGARANPMPTHHPQSPESVVHHLVLACHRLLLNIYAPLLKVLQQDTASTAANFTVIVDDFSMPSPVDIRLVLLVQLSSYFIDRLHSGINVCCYQLRSSDDMRTDAQVRQRLMQLRSALHI